MSNDNKQHQGEPVALPERKDPTAGWAVPGGVHKAEGWNACLDEIAKLGPLYSRPVQGEPVACVKVDFLPEGAIGRLIWFTPSSFEPGQELKLYTHTDPGEVELLRAELEKVKANSKQLAELDDAFIKGQSEKLRAATAQLAERDALLRKALASCDEATAAFEDDPNGPGQWTCHACFAECKPVWRHGHIIAGGPNQIEHEADCWAEQARKLLSASAGPSASEEPKGDTLRAQLVERDRQLECAVRLLMPNAGQFRGSGAWAVEVDRFIAGLEKIPLHNGDYTPEELAGVKGNCHCCQGKRKVMGYAPGIPIDCPVCCSGKPE